MGAGARRLSLAFEVTEDYWYIFNKKRFWRWLYASLNIFAIFAMVVVAFEVGDETSQAANKFEHSDLLANPDLEENVVILWYIHAFYPSPFFAAWMLVYFPKFIFFCKIKRFRKARNFHYNLLLLSIISFFFYGILFKFYLKMTLATGAKLRIAVLMIMCELTLIMIEIFDEQKERRIRHAKKRAMLEEQEIRSPARTPTGSNLHPLNSSQHSFQSRSTPQPQCQPHHSTQHTGQKRQYQVSQPQLQGNQYAQQNQYHHSSGKTQQHAWQQPQQHHSSNVKNYQQQHHFT